MISKMAVITHRFC